MVIQNAKTCNYNPQTLQATCNVKELLKAHHASDGTAVANTMNPAMLQAAQSNVYIEVYSLIYYACIQIDSLKLLVDIISLLIIIESLG